MDPKIYKNQRGFSFVEILVAFAIITTSMVAIFSLIMQNIQVQKINKDFLVASMLSQEGLELVRAIRDENWKDQLVPDVWDDIDTANNDDFVIDFTSYSDVVDNINDTITDDPGTRLYLDVDKFYTHTVTPDATQFYRIIEVDDMSASSVEVSSRVEWKIRGKIHSYVATTVLYDWK